VVVHPSIVEAFRFTAQAGDAGAPDAQSNPMSTWLREAYTRNRNTIVRLAEKMPEENYGMRPGTQTEVRTFGQQVQLATFNFL
jgi:hypothetical protein